MRISALSPLDKAKCESSAHTHHTCLDSTLPSNLGLFSCKATKNTCVDLSVLARVNMRRSFFINPNCLSIFMSICCLRQLDICLCFAKHSIYFRYAQIRYMDVAAQVHKKTKSLAFCSETAYISKA